MVLNMDDLKNWGQVCAWGAAVIGTIYAILKGNRESRASTEARLADLRWKQANAAKELIADIHNHPQARVAVDMMDRENVCHEYEVAKEKTAILNYQNVIEALTKERSNCSPDAEDYIHECFDWFFYFVDRIQHYIDRDLIQLADVYHVFKPYVKRIADHRPLYDQFLKSHDYDLALKFWQSYPEYREAQSDSRQKPQARGQTAAGL